jgi:hypothetical protein
VTGLVAFVVLTGATLLVQPRLRAWLARRTAARLAAGRPVKFAVRLRGRGGAYPKRWRWGTVRANDGQGVRWHPTFLRTGPIPLGGLRLVRGRVSGQHDRVELSRVLVMRDADGNLVELGVRGSLAETLRDVLAGTPAEPMPPAAAPERERRGVPVWVRLLAGLAVAWAIAWAYAAVAGDHVTARVLENEEDYCRVEWTGRSGSVESTGVDCDDEQPGEPLPVLAMPPPLEGEAVASAYAWWWFGIPLGMLVAPVGWHAAGRLRRSRSRGPTPGDVPPAEEDLPALAAGDLVYSRIAAAMRRRADLEGWAPPPAREGEQPGDPLWSGPARGMATSALRWIVFPALFGALAVLYGWGWWGKALLFDPATGVGATGVVRGSYDPEGPLLPWEVRVEFDAGGSRVEATVASRTALKEGAEVALRYDAGKPERARLAGPDDRTGRAALISGTVAAVCAGLVAWRLRRTWTTIAMLRRRRAQPPQPMRYVLFADFEGEPGVALFPVTGDPPPAAFVPLWAPLPRGVPVYGTGVVHGRVEDGEAVVLTVEGRTLWPVDAAEAVEEDLALALLNGDLPYDEEDTYGEDG